MKRVYVLPNLFTSGNLFFGMLAIIEISQYASHPENAQPLRYACWYILLAALMDALDGKVARLTRTQSEFGVEYDSLADLISFGAAPAFLIYISFLRDINNRHLAALATIMFVICGALRLARYNVQHTTEEKKSFTGLPIPAAACMIISTYLLLRRYDVNFLIKGLPVLMMVLSLLMVSKISYPSLKAFPIERAMSFQFLLVILMVFCVIYGLKDFKEILVFSLFTCYLVFGVAVEVYQLITGRHTDIAEALEKTLAESMPDEDSR